LEQHHQEKMPILREDELKVVISRGVTSATSGNDVNDLKSWKDEAQIGRKFVTSKGKEDIFQKKFLFSATFQLKVRPLSGKTT
jgi:hypothetical protein